MSSSKDLIENFEIQDLNEIRLFKLSFMTIKGTRSLPNVHDLNTPPILGRVGTGKF